MKLPPVDYEAPKTVPEAVELLGEHLDQASVLAGGQSLIPLLALRLAHPVVLIDINGVDGLSGVSLADGPGVPGRQGQLGDGWACGHPRRLAGTG
jgi:carbon-monoxide dehydrogenase medium subunit